MLDRLRRVGQAKAFRVRAGRESAAQGRGVFEPLHTLVDFGAPWRATIDSLQQAAKTKVDELINENPTRRDLAEKLEELIKDYNEGFHNVHKFFEQIRDFIETLSHEEQRHAALVHK